MGNKPSRDEFVGLGFTERLTRHPRIGYYIYPDELCGRASKSSALVVFVVDQLLVVSRLAADMAFNEALSRYAGPTGVHVFDSEKSGVAEEDNIQIWQLKGEHASGNKTHADVAEAVWALRRELPDELRPMIAPNHVLVPCGRTHECPWGPPEEHSAVTLPARVSPAVEVVVIDSGFIMASPVATVVTNVSFGEWLVQVPAAAAAAAYEWQPGTEAPPGAVSPLDQNGNGMLDALAGHANFVVGVVAQGCEYAELSVESLSSSVIDNDTSIPGFVTEAEVARAWWEHRNAPIANIGFAFATLPNQPLAVDSDPNVVNGPPSWALQVVMNAIGNTEEHVVVAPAGNQNCTVPQYPAAFSLTHQNVAGVGSVDASGNRSTFSNHGPWVNCCTTGEDVASAFVDRWHGQTEEAELDPAVPPHPLKTFAGWASWNGTSFAAPKVAAAIAELVATGTANSPGDAWEQLQAGGPTAGLDMGKRLDGLSP